MSCGNCGNGGCGGCSGCGSVDASQVILNPVPAGVRPCSPLAGTCGNPSPATPAPYYECTSQCQEDHCSSTVYNNYAASVCTTYSFVIPDCEETVNVTFSNVTNLPLGSYLWHDTFGYFRVEAFNSSTGIATLKYRCLDEDKSGLPVPACTCFVVTDPPAETSANQLVPYLAADFTAPANGDCVTISVTTIAGLIVGSEIALASGIYVIDEILSPNTIVICNSGGGILPGTVVFAYNSLGQLQYPILNVQTNPCAGVTVTAGSALVCDGSATRILTGANVGDILTLTNVLTGEAAYTSICAGAAVVAGPVLVCDGNPAPLDGGTPGEFVVLTDATTNEAQYINLGFNAEDTLGAEEATFFLNNNDTHSTGVITYSIPNPNTLKSMKVMVVATLKFEVQPVTVDGVEITITHGIEHQVNSGGYTDMKRLTSNYIPSPPSFTGVEIVTHTVYTIVPSGSVLLEYRGFVSDQGTGVLDVTSISDMQLQVSYIALAA